MSELPKSTLRIAAGIIIIITILMGVVYYVYLSPHGLKARENSDLARVDEGEVVQYLDLNGNDVDLTTYQGEVLIINMWASWSPFTNADHEILARLKMELGDRVTVRAVNRMESIETAKAYLDTIGMRDGIEYVVDTTDHLYQSQSGYAMPETFIFDDVGNMHGHVRGTISYEDFYSQVATLLSEGE